MRANGVLAAGLAALVAVMIGGAPAQARATDTEAPVVTLDQPAALNPQTVSGVAGTAPGDGSGVTLEFFAGTTAGGLSSAAAGAGRGAGGVFTAGVPRLADGTWTVRAVQGDTAGNTGTSPERTFRVDFHGPDVTITSPEPVTADAQPHFEGEAGTAPGDIADVSLTVTAAGGAATTFPATLLRGGSFVADAPAPLADGAYTVVARQVDDLGHVGESPPLRFQIETTTPPAPEVNTAPSIDVPVAPVVAPAVVAPPPVVAKAAAGLKISSASTSRLRRTTTVRVRGTLAGAATGRVTVTAAGVHKAATRAKGRWTVTLKLTRTRATSLTVTVTYAGDRGFLAQTAKRTVRVRH